MSQCNLYEYPNPNGGKPRTKGLTPVYPDMIRTDGVHYSKIIWGDCMNGKGMRLTIFLSGCPHNCPGCFSPETHDPLYGREMEMVTEEEMIEFLQSDFCDGITFLGGDPLAPCNYEWTLKMAKKAKKYGKSVIVYTGYTYNNIPYEMDNYVDTYVDGMFIERLQCDTPGKGSSNQRFMKKQEMEDSVGNKIVWFKEVRDLYE